MLISREVINGRKYICRSYPFAARPIVVSEVTLCGVPFLSFFLGVSITCICTPGVRTGSHFFALPLSTRVGLYFAVQSVPQRSTKMGYLDRDNGASLIACNIVPFALTWAFSLVRIYVRRFVLKIWKIEDWLFIASQVSVHAHTGGWEFQY